MGPISPSAFSVCFLSHRAFALPVPALKHFSALTSVAWALRFPSPARCRGCLLPLPRRPHPGPLTAGAESLASSRPALRGHFLQCAALASCLSLTGIVAEIVSVELYLSGHRCLPRWHPVISLPGLTLRLHLPPPEPLPPCCGRLAETQQDRAGPAQLPREHSTLGKITLPILPALFRCW